jgi:hypothetical protein
VPALELKGKARSLAAWRVSRILPGARPFLRRLDTRFVGRQAELVQLHQAFQRVVAERSAYLFTVLGTPGIGKSRLAVEFSGAVEREATILSGRSLPYGEGITYRPLREILQTAFGDGLKWLGDCLSDRAEVMLLLGPADEGEAFARGGSRRL